MKVLDFGLAKLTEVGGTVSVGRAAGSHSPTLTSPAAMTGMGVILGTAAYMAPEQARGQVVDKRGDIWAFGVVLYEMLTGRRLFDDETVSDTLAAVLKETPIVGGSASSGRCRCCAAASKKIRSGACGTSAMRWHCWKMRRSPRPQRHPSDMRRGCGRALRRCSASHWPRWPSSTTASGRRLHPRPRASRSCLPRRSPSRADSPFAVSPDGRKFVFGAAGSDNVVRLWLRALDSLETRPLAGTEINGVVPPPFWSPDSRFVAFDDGAGKLKKIDITGGPAQTLCDVPTGTFVGGSWNDDGVIIFAMNFAGVMRVSAAGGVASPVTRVDSSRREVTQVFPFFLPDGRHFLYYRFSNGPEGSGLYAGSLDVKPDEQSSAKLLTTTSGMVAFVPLGFCGRSWSRTIAVPARGDAHGPTLR